jgi:hypothetical protein
VRAIAKQAKAVRDRRAKAWRPGWSRGSGRTQQVERKTASDNLLREAAMPQRNSLTYAAAIEDVDRLFDAQLEAARVGRLDEVRRLILQLDRAKRRLTKLSGNPIVIGAVLLAGYSRVWGLGEQRLQTIIAKSGNHAAVPTRPGNDTLRRTSGAGRE